jgi:hypothetical protein
MTESFTKKRVLSSLAVHKIQSARVLIAPALLTTCSLQAFAQDSVTFNDDTGQFLPGLVKPLLVATLQDADGKHFTCLSQN